MTENCELCGRGMARRTVTPTYWPYENVCERAGCRSAVKDAYESIDADRDGNKELVGNIAVRHESQWEPVGWRHDAFCSIDLRDDDWWALDPVKNV